MMFLAWRSTHLTCSEWKGRMGTWKTIGWGGDHRSRWRLDGDGAGDIRHPATGSTSEYRGPEPSAETGSKVLPYVSSITVPTSYRSWSVAISWTEHSSLKGKEAAFTTYMLMNRNDIEHLKQNVPIFILHGQIFALIFMRDSSFISPRDFSPAQREGIKDK